MKASGSSSSLQYSVVEANTPWSFEHGFDQMAPREVEEARHHLQKLTIGSAPDAATGNADVDLPSASNARVPKRGHSVFTSGSVSAPARPTIPLPDVEYVQLEDKKRRKFLATAPALPQAPASASASTSTPAPSPTFPSPASRRPQRRRGNRRRGGGATRGTRKKAQGERFPCAYCVKTFTRKQDRDRHSRTACNASPLREAVVCPECHTALSRVDAVQRHWRQHENPTCPTPGWALSRRY